MKFLIVGCGIGGLSAAHALAQNGHQIQLFERAAELKPVGAGISLQPNAMQALKRLGVAQLIQNAAWPAEQAQICASDGKVLTLFDFGNYLDKFGFLPMTIYRGDLVNILARALSEKVGPSEILLDQQVASFSEGQDDLKVKTEAGIEHRGEALIAADGIHSVVRRRLWDKQVPRYAGYTCWRGMVDDRELVGQVDTMTEVWGKGARFGFMRCNERQVYWFATEDRKSRTDHERDSTWKARFQDWMRPIPQLLNATEDAAIFQNDIVDLVPIRRWSKGKVTLLGDAAHAMTPNFGQGGAQAIEDAVVLGLACKGSNSIEESFQKYESARITRTTGLVKGSRQFGWIGQGGNGFSRLIRNYIMPNLPKSFVDRQLATQCDFEGYLARTDLV